MLLAILLFLMPPACPLIDDIADPEAFCKANPWGRASECGGDGPTPEACLESLESMLGCGVSSCDFAACAASFAIAACDERPRSCDGVAMCD